MPKNINTPREELICGKLDLLIELVKKGEAADAVYLIEDIRHDAIRMEAKLIIRKQESTKYEVLIDAVKTVVDGYEGDGMENMGARDDVFYETCKAALNQQNDSKPPQQIEAEEEQEQQRLKGLNFR